MSYPLIPNICDTPIAKWMTTKERQTYLLNNVHLCPMLPLTRKFFKESGMIETIEEIAARIDAIVLNLTVRGLTISQEYLVDNPLMAMQLHNLIMKSAQTATISRYITRYREWKENFKSVLDSNVITKLNEAFMLEVEGHTAFADLHCPVVIKFKLQGGFAPKKGKPDDAAYDVFAKNAVRIPIGKRVRLKLGIYSQIPKGYYVQFKEKSGLADRCGLEVKAGVIDARYRDEWEVILRNEGDKVILFDVGDKMFQFTLEKVIDSRIEIVTELDMTENRGGGFGSTGK